MTSTCPLLTVLALTFSLAWTTPAAGEAAPLGAVRNLGDFINSDGKPPDGVANDVDDTGAMAAALARGPGVVQIGPGHYRFGDVTIPEAVTVIGCGRATIVHRGNAKSIFRQHGEHRWILRDLVLAGAAKGDWKQRKDLGHSGVFVKRCNDWEISGLVVRDFSGAGIDMTWVYSAAPWKTNGTIANIQVMGNHTGVRFDERAEYINASALGCWQNVIGCVVHGGNIKITNSNFTSNLTGLYIEDKDNGSHGSITNCLVNHNEQYSLRCRKVVNGMPLDACCFFGGRMLIEDSNGISVTSGIIGCPVTVTGGQANRIAGNCMRIEETFVYEFSPATIVQDNFTGNGLWKRNR